MSDAIAGVGTKFQRERDNSSGTYADIAEVNSIGGPNKSRGTIDVTSLDSAAGYREFIGSFRDSGEISLNMNWTIAGYEDMNDDFESADLKAYRIVLPDTAETTFDFEGFVTAINQSVSADDKVTMDVTIKISGAVLVASP